MAFSFSKFALGFSAKRIFSRSALGIDIGTSSVKVVQVRKEHGIAVLESYGEIEFNRYGSSTGESADFAARTVDAEPIGAVVPSPEQISNALMDLIGEVKISSRSAGVSILSSSTLIFVVDMPARTEEQLSLLMPSETKKYIPSHVGEVLLDWFVIPDEASQHNVFDTMMTGPSVEPKRQKILLAAIYKETVSTYEKIVKGANLDILFYEIEAASGARASQMSVTDTVLVLDLGATSTKLYIVQRNIVRALHTVKLGGNDLTNSLAENLQININSAEKVKRERGLTTSSLCTREENEKVLQALTSQLLQITSKAKIVIGDYSKKAKKNVAKVILIGGGAQLEGVESYLKTELSLPVEIARPFNRTKGPIVLEGTLHDAGPTFANAIGLALRAIGM
jgi:type IV pilus assembly protein PilM